MNYNRSETVHPRQTPGHASEPASYAATRTKRSSPTKDVAQVTESLRLIDDLKFFLATAPANWQENQVIRRYYLNPDEGFVSCVYWNNLYFITGTDIVRCMVHKFQHFGREIVDRKKFEEGVFSDLRNLKCGTDAVLESPKSEFLEFLFKNSCLRTQKKQKVFFWFNVPHDKLMAEALERDLKKERMNMSPTTVAKHEPALSFNFSEGRTNIHTQLAEHLDKQIQMYLPALAAIAKTQPLANGSDRFMPFSASPASDRTIKTESLLKTSPEYTTANKDAGEILEYGPPKEFPVEDSETATTNPANRETKYEFLSYPTPTHNQADPTYQEDFPLDYFHFPDANDHEYLNLDPNLLQGVYANVANENLEALVDPQEFMRAGRSRSGLTPFQPRFAADARDPDMANQLFYNDEYLIEQTVPLKLPLAGLPNSAYGFRSARLGSTNGTFDEFFLGALQHTPGSAAFHSLFFKGDHFSMLHNVGPGAVHPRLSGGTPGHLHMNSPLLQSNGTFHEPEAWSSGSAPQLTGTEDGALLEKLHSTPGTNRILEQYPMGYTPVYAVQCPPVNEDSQETEPISALLRGEKLYLRRGLNGPLLQRGVHKPPIKQRRGRSKQSGDVDDVIEDELPAVLETSQEQMQAAANN